MSQKEQRTHYKTDIHQRIPFMSDPRLVVERKLENPKHVLGQTWETKNMGLCC